MQKEMDYNEVVITIQKHVVNFCNCLPIFIDKWTVLLQEVEKPLSALLNYSEQLRHVEMANVKYIEGFEDLQSKLLYKIGLGIEEEAILIRRAITLLNLANQEMKNKLSLLERSCMDLDWEKEIPLLQGTAFQPPLSKILQEGYRLLIYFTMALKLINEDFKNLNVRSEKAMKDFENKFKVNTKDNINSFLAVIQYVNIK